MKKHIVLFVAALCITLSAAVAQTRITRNVGNFTRINFRVPGTLHLKQGSTNKLELEGDSEYLQKIETDTEGTTLVIGRENGKWFSWNDDNSKRIDVYVTIATLEGLSVSGSGDLIGESKFTANDLSLKVSGSGALKIEVDASGDMDADVSGSGDIDLRGKAKNFESHVSGSGKVNIGLAITNTADFGVSGSGKILASGSASSVKASISGSGKVLAANLQTNRCQVRISGSGDVEINVKDELDANISGSGSVGYRGEPSKINSHSSGSGKVHKL